MTTNTFRNNQEPTTAKAAYEKAMQDIDNKARQVADNYEGETANIIYLTVKKSLIEQEANKLK